MLSFPDTPQVNNIHGFRALAAKHGDFAKVARYVVQIVKPGASDMARDLSFLCDNAELPGRAFHTNDVRYYGPTFQMPFQSVYTMSNLTFLCRDRFWERQFFDLWMNQINPKSTYDFTYRDQYCSSINIFQLSEAAKSNREMEARYTMTLRKAYPINVNPMPLSWASEDIHRLQVTFSYVDWVTHNDANDEGLSQTFKLVPGEIVSSGKVLGSIHKLTH